MMESNIHPIEHQQSLVHLLSFNAWALPIWLPYHDQQKRYKAIPQRLIDTNADIICIQEAFADSFRRQQLTATSDHYDIYSDYSCNRLIAGLVKMDCHGGLMTLSKYPIEEEQFYAFPKSRYMRWEESLGAKGFLLTKLQVNQNTVYVINTHLYAGLTQADELHQLVQIKYMHEVLEDHNVLSHDIFLLGDLNILHPSIAE